MRQEPSFFVRPTAATLTILAIIGRLIPHPANFTPVGAAALFGGAKIARPWNYLLPLFVMVITDLIIGAHGTMLYVYASFLIAVFLGEKLLSSKVGPARVVLASVSGATIFFLVTNFGVWAEGILYPKTLAGLLDCYMMALPFFRNTLLGDVIYSVGFFSLYSWANQTQVINILDRRIAGLVTGR